MSQSPARLIKQHTRKLQQYIDLPHTNDWLVCPNGHLVAQYQRNDRIGGHSWHRYLHGAETSTQHGGRQIRCGICNAIALSANYRNQPFVCSVVADHVAQDAINLIDDRSEGPKNAA